jgi:hypothetical protein
MPCDTPNKAASGNSAGALWFHAVRLRRAVPALRRSALARHTSAFKRALWMIAAVSLPLMCCVLATPPADEFRVGGSLSHFLESKPDNAGLVFFEGHTTNQTLILVLYMPESARQAKLLSAVSDWHGTNQNMASVTVRFYRRGGLHHGRGLPPVLAREKTIVSPKTVSEPIYPALKDR